MHKGMADRAKKESTIQALDSLVSADAELNNIDLPIETAPARTKAYFKVLKEMGLTYHPGWRRRFHDIRETLPNLNKGETADYYQSNKSSYQGAISRVQTDNIFPFYQRPGDEPWNLIQVEHPDFPTSSGVPLKHNHPTVSAPGILLMVIQGMTDPTLPHQAHRTLPHKKKNTPRSRLPKGRTSSPGGPSLNAQYGPLQSKASLTQAPNASHRTRRTPPLPAPGMKTKKKKRRTGRGTAHRITKGEKKAQVYCPHMQKHNGKYVKTNSSHILRHNGHKYSFRTCCQQCANVIKTNPKYYVVNMKNKRCYIGLRHSTTDQIVQYAKKTAKTCRRK